MCGGDVISNGSSIVELAFPQHNPQDSCFPMRERERKKKIASDCRADCADVVCTLIIFLDRCRHSQIRQSTSPWCCLCGQSRHARGPKSCDRRHWFPNDDSNFHRYRKERQSRKTKVRQTPRTMTNVQIITTRVHYTRTYIETNRPTQFEPSCIAIYIRSLYRLGPGNNKQNNNNEMKKHL